jgi:hypothetical protein
MAWQVLVSSLFLEGSNRMIGEVNLVRVISQACSELLVISGSCFSVKCGATQGGNQRD